MSELRWILLLVGVLFLLLLTAWESRRSRLARAAARERVRALAETIPFDRVSPESTSVPAPATHEIPLDGPDPNGEPIAIRAQRRSSVPSEDLPSMMVDARGTPDASAQFQEPQAPAAQAEPQAESQPSPQAGSQAEPPGDPQASESMQPEEFGTLADGIPGLGVTVEWPPEEQRRIVSVRIVGTGEQRLSGRATRQALAACGFVHGRYRIFHQPDSEGHALVSCASLNKPGVFDPNSMDYQRYSGLSLFTVLPGPLSPPDAVDRLLHTALDLSERLQARLQDEEGQTLDELRIAQIRTHYREVDAMAGPPA